MAYDRYDRDTRTRPYGRDRFQDRNESRLMGGDGRRDERGWFERAGDELASWFGDDDAESRRRRDEAMDRGYSRRHPDDDRFGRSRHPYRDADYDRFEGFSPMRGPARGEFGPEDRGDFITSRRARAAEGSRFGSVGSRAVDPQYQDWRQRQIDELDRDYDEYRRENQARFESEFGSWRERRQSKRALLSSIREQMEVVGSDGEHVGTIDRVAGDRIILAKSDPDAGGVHHSLSCADIDRIEENRVILDCNAADAKTRWRDENRARALFEREDQGEVGPRILDRSFEGTYR